MPRNLDHHCPLLEIPSALVLIEKDCRIAYLALCLVRWHEVIVRASLRQQALRYQIVELSVTRIIPIVN